LMPIHPRTRNILEKQNINLHKNIKILDPVGYLEMIYLIKKSYCIMTDSGGLQKEAYFFKKECITIRKETEWTELITQGYNTLVGCNQNKIKKAYLNIGKKDLDFSKDLYGKGKACKKIVKLLNKLFIDKKSY